MCHIVSLIIEWERDVEHRVGLLEGGKVRQGGEREDCCRRL